MMKILAFSFVFAVALSEPALAQTDPNPPANASADVIDESLILEASSLEDRMALLRRCAGPPPKAMIAANQPKQTPVSEPVAIAERVEPAVNSHGG